MVQTQARPLSLDAFLALPETKPASEYIDGQIIQKPIPQGRHSRFQDKLVNVINAAVETQKIACAFPELRCTFGGASIVPDIAVFTWGHIPVDAKGKITDVFLLAPDWTIEVLSPGQGYRKIRKKVIRCLQHGTQIGWLIDPDEESVTIYKSKKDIEILELIDEPEALLPFPEFMQGLTFTVKDLFDLLLL